MSHETLVLPTIQPSYQPGQKHPAANVARRLGLHSRLSAQAGAALDRLLGRSTRFEARAVIAESGEDADLVTIVEDGFVCRMNLLPDGRRQIHSLFLPGDTVDAETPLLGVRPDNVEALTDCSVWLVPQARLAGLLQTQPELAKAFARESAIGAQVAREWVVNIGQRTALERIAHLICELYARMDAVGLVTNGAFVLPLTQRDIADAQGLSAVHVNRVLQDLRRKGLIRADRRRLAVLDWGQLQRLALFDGRYLHLSQVAAK